MYLWLELRLYYIHFQSMEFHRVFILIYEDTLPSRLIISFLILDLQQVAKNFLHSFVEGMFAFIRSLRNER